jgi:NAD-dependent deacetylase
MTSRDAQSLADLLLDVGLGGTVVFTGAGISTESGIPDFRSPGGLWTRYAPIDYADYLSDPAMRQESWRRGLHTYPPMAAAQPNAAHLAIATWFRAGLVTAVVTQNIDGLHQKAGVPDAGVIELHGNAHWINCLQCGARFDRPSVHARVEGGEADPACPDCGGMLKAATISFGQALPLEAIEAAQRLHAVARLCLVVGSSLVVYPAAALPRVTLDTGGELAIVNLTETHLDRFATLLSREPAAVLLAGARRLTAGAVSLTERSRPASP